MTARGGEAAKDLAGWLTFAAAPTFAIVALMTALRPEGLIVTHGSTGHGGSLLGGMVFMYALMSTFHSSHWLNLIGARLSPIVSSDMQRNSGVTCEDTIT